MTVPSATALRRALPPVLLACLAVPSGAAGKVGFAFCSSGVRADCVVDGDTFWMNGRKIRIADIDTPEIHGPRCVMEAALGLRATERLRALLNAGPFFLQRVERDQDHYGRSLRIILRDGQSLGARLVAEGLARPWSGSRQPWCRS